METTTFTDWLLNQTSRADDIGRLARDTQQDNDRPKGKVGIVSYTRHLRKMRADNWAYLALGEAYKEYLSSGSFQKFDEPRPNG